MKLIMETLEEVTTRSTPARNKQLIHKFYPDTYGYNYGDVIKVRCKRTNSDGVEYWQTKEAELTSKGWVDKN